MDPPNPNPNPASMRVLIRPPPSSHSSPSPQTIPIPSTSDPPSTDGVVVVGFIGRSTDDSAQLINRILDYNVFGSGNRDKTLGVENEEWLKWRRVRYYHEEQKGILFLRFCSTLCSAVDGGSSDSRSGFDSVFEEHDFGDLQGMLFMFSVCHVIIYILEGPRFDSQLLKKFRVLQAAKHALAPLVRPRNVQRIPSKPYSSSSWPATSASSKNSSPGRGGGMLTRNASLMSDLGSYTSLFPGQCTPVTLFVFIDDFSDVPNPSSIVEDSADTSVLSQPSSLGTSARPSLPVKGSGSVVVLACPVSKSEGGFKKKLQSSLEAQIRFLIKKCRTLSGSETSHAGSRNGGASSSAPLFSLDASKAVLLLDRCTNQRGESLEFATGLVEDVLNGKATSDSLLLESHGQNASKEDIISVKEFIYRQSDILRGRGGVVTNSNSGSAAGVGMAAVAAAVAAASTASAAAASTASAAAATTSGKTLNAPELPTLQIWLSSSQQILHGVLSAKGGCIDETEISKGKPRTWNSIPQPFEGVSSKAMDPLDLAVSWLESGNKMNSRFSTLWCERTLPVAKEVYLKDLPACYPTSQHEAHLERALHAFHSMVKGQAVQHFAKKLEDECTSIWKSGRQLCDAVSLTGKPCMHQRHDVDASESLLGDTVKQHSSGYVFLHACSCGRSRRLRSDPFDFDSANITFSCFPDCDKLLPTLQLPEVSSSGPIQSSSWSLIRIGGARYYEPHKGLLQSGFCSTQKFLLKWTISMEIQKSTIDLTAKAVDQGSAVRSGKNFKLESKADVQLHSKESQSRVESHRKPAEDIVSDDNKINFGKGLPNFTMRKPFSEVVAGRSAADSGFPPIQPRKKSSSSLDQSFKQIRLRDQSADQTSDKGIQKSRDDLRVQETVGGISSTDGDPYLRIGSNVIPMNLNGVERSNPSLKHVTVYVGFEHECPRGHRFLLNPENLNELGSSYQLPEESQVKSDYIRADSSKLSRNGFHGKAHRNSNRITATGTNRERNVNKSKDMVTIGIPNSDGKIQFSGSGKEHNQTISVSTVPYFSKHDAGSFQSINIDDGGCAFSMLNRNLPIYMSCPHCRLPKNSQDPPNTKFSGTISQLQRIFMVTPPFPVILATCPVIQFEASCLSPSIPEREQKLQFSLGCQVVLPSESFLTLRLPFVYGVELEDGSLHSLNCFEHQPEATAWITKGTTLQVISKSTSIGQD